MKERKKETETKRRKWVKLGRFWGSSLFFHKDKSFNKKHEKGKVHWTDLTLFQMNWTCQHNSIIFEHSSQAWKVLSLCGDFEADAFKKTKNNSVARNQIYRELREVQFPKWLLQKKKKKKKKTRVYCNFITTAVHKGAKKYYVCKTRQNAEHKLASPANRRASFNGCCV